MQTTQLSQATEIECADVSGDKACTSAGNNQKAAPPFVPARPVRWLPQRKAEILSAVRRGSISLDQACAIYDLSIEEFMTWQLGNTLYGLAGLRATTNLRKHNSIAVNPAPADPSGSESRYAPRENSQ
jgi:Protein of unknown function (DUF1153)